MLVHVLSMALSADSQQWLTNITTPLPEIRVDLAPRVEIFSSVDPEFAIEYNEGVALEAVTLGLVELYDDFNGATSAYVNLESKDLRELHLMAAGNFEPAWSQGYVPYFVLVKRMPPRKRRLVAWMNSISNVMARPNDITLVDPRIDSFDIEVMPDQAFRRRFGL